MIVRWPVMFAAVLVIAIDLSAQGLPAGQGESHPEDQRTMRLWEDDAPGAQGKAQDDVPTLTVYRPQMPSGAAVVVCPGGGYGGLAEHEGKPVAQWLNTVGVTGFVLKYRLGPKYHHPVELGDVLRAIRYVRFHAMDWKLDPQRVGVLGFSAGGHLASTAMTHFDNGDPSATDPIDKLASRPDFGILIYPVITLEGPNAHAGSRKNLLGDNPSPELVELLSSQKQVTDRTPPCFLVHSSDDGAVPFKNSLLFADALHAHHVPVELHVFDHGGHGFGLGPKDPVLREWPNLCARWMEFHGWLKPGATVR